MNNADIWSLVIEFSQEKERKNIALVEKKGYLAYETVIPSLERMSFLVKSKIWKEKYPYLNCEEYISKWKKTPVKLLFLLKDSYLAFDVEFLTSILKINKPIFYTFVSNLGRREDIGQKFDSEVISRDFLIASYLHSKGDIKNLFRFLSYSKLVVFFIFFANTYLKWEIKEKDFIEHNFTAFELSEFNSYITLPDAIERYNSIKH